LHSFVCSSVRLASLLARKWSEEFLAELRKEGGKDKTYRKVKKEAASEELVPKDRKVKEEILEIRDGLLYWKKLLWAPEGMVQQIMESEHDTRVAGHMGQDKTIKLVRRNFWWLKMNERIIDFIRSCPECQQNKAA